MIRSTTSRWGNRLCGGLCVWAALLAGTTAADPLREETSLRFVPADAAFYGTALRNREQFDALVNSRAAAKLMEIPAVQMGIQGLQMLFAPGAGMEGFDAENFGEPESEFAPGDEESPDDALPEDDAPEDDASDDETDSDDGAGRDGDRFKQPPSEEADEEATEPAFGQDEPVDGDLELSDEFAPDGEMFPSGPSFSEMMADPQNQELLALLGDAVSHEVFFYGGDGFTGLFELAAFANTLQAEMGPLDFAATPEEMQRQQNERSLQTLQKLVEFLDQNPGVLVVPELIVGFKLTDAVPAEAQIARLEAAWRESPEIEAEWKDRLTRETVAGNEYLTLRVDGSAIDWEAQLADVAAEERELARKAFAQIEALTAVVSLGIREDYLLLSIGPTNDRLAKLGEGPLLVDAAELAPVAADGEQRFTGISYVGREFMRKALESQGGVEQIAQMAEAVIPLMDDLPEELRAEMLVDAAAFAADMQRYVPEPGAAMSYSFLNGRGYEGYDYQWGEQPGYDGSQPLTILENLGGDPLYFSAARHATSLEDYDLAVKWIEKLVYYGRAMAFSTAPPEEQQAMEQVFNRFAPLAKRVDQITRELLGPALDGQAAFVFDADLTSKTWHQAMPSETPLPMLEFGFVLGVRDAEKLKQACGQYFDVAQQALIVAGNFGPTGGPPPALPLPKSREFATHTIYYYVLPKEIGFDKRIAPNGGVSSSMAAVSLLPLYTQRLLEPRSLLAEGPVAEHHGQPLAAASGLNFAGTVDAVRPWIDLGIDSYVAAMGATMEMMEQMQREAVDEGAFPAEEGFPTEDGPDGGGDDELPNNEPDDELPSDDESTEGDAGGRFGDEDQGIEGQPGEEFAPQGPSFGSLVPSAEEIKAQVGAFLDVISCFRGYSSVTYQQDGAWVTHRESRFEDLPAE